MSKRAKAFLLVACIVALVTFFCPRKVNSRRLPAAEGKNHIGETATACGKVVATNWAARKGHDADTVPMTRRSSRCT
jgi:hypothetical protein